MEEKVLSALRTIGYEVTDDGFRAAVQEAPKSTDYSNIVHFITNELRTLCAIDEEVNVIASPEDSVSFLMEISSFLKELGCPYHSLSQGPLSERLNNLDDKLLLLNYLVSELMASRILQESKPDKQIELKLRETPEAHNVIKILKTLRCSKPPENITLQDLFEKMNLKVETLALECDKELLSEPMWNYQLNGPQWEKLSYVQKDLHAEYTIRRKMMLQRLDCTIQSFQWSDKMKSKGDLIMKTYSEKRKQLKVEPDVDVSSLLSARTDLAIIEKTSNSSVRKNTKSEVNRVVIGKVPDRGGRTSEQQAPAPEMPSWQQRQAGPSGGRGGNRGGGGGGRGRGDNRGDRGGYQRGGGGAGGPGGNNYDNRQKQQNYDAAGSYTTTYHQSNTGYNQQQQGQQGYGNQYHQRQDGNQYQQRQDSQYHQRQDGNQYQQRQDGNQYQQRQEGNQYQQRQDGSQYQPRQEDNYQNEPKRPKTYDSFQNSQRTTYADQYVQESQYNQQYQPRHNNRGGGGGRGGGRSNYQRGGRGGGGGGQNYY